MRHSELNINNLSFAWQDDRLVFSHLNFEIGSGTALQLVGKNGSGKTSLLKILAGLIQPTIGKIKWKGHDINVYRPEYLNDVIYIGHQHGMKLTLSARENLNFYLGLYGQQVNSSVLDDALNELELKSLVDEPLLYLSAGQQRRVSLARLLLRPASLWLLDEPFTALDEQGCKWLEACMQSQLNQHGAIVFSTHRVVTYFPSHIFQLGH